MKNNLDNLTQFILDNAAEEAKAMLDSAAAESQSLVDEANYKFDTLRAQQIEHLAEESRKRIAEAAATQDVEAQKELTRFIHELIDELFEETKRTLYALSAEEFLAFYRRTVNDLTLEGDFQVVLGQLTADSLNEQQRGDLAIQEERFRLILDERTIPSEGGFLLEKLPIEYSFIFSDLLGELKRKESPNLFKRLIR